jgi:sulfane dehydrogenase subunit SoxC
MKQARTPADEASGPATTVPLPHGPPLQADELASVAGGGLLDRRLFLRRGLVLSGLGISARPAIAAPPAAAPVDASARPSWMREPGQPFTNYGQPSPQQRSVARWVSANRGVAGNGVSWTPLHELEGIITPSGLHFERHHNGVPQIPIDQHQLMIHGLARRSLTFPIEALSRYPLRSQILFVECGGNSNAGWHQLPQQTRAGFLHGLASCSEWTGVPLATLLDEAGVDPAASWVIAEGADAAAIQVSLPLAKAMKDCMLALFQNGERIRPENGYPLRLIVPGWEGVLNIKWLRRLELASGPVMARNETARYTELLPSGKARMFTFVMDAKSLITSPSPGHRLKGPGIYEVRGLAWTGRGRIRSVEVSADGGASWAPAQLQEPVLPMAFTRFRLPWRWSGAPSVLKSRATDESGYVQPERKALVAERGRHGYFHYNAVVSWEVDEDGEISHVYR